MKIVQPNEPLWSGCLSRSCFVLFLLSAWIIVSGINCVAGVGE